MRILVLSDLHANSTALAAALDTGRRPLGRIAVCLGDVVGYGPDPHEVVARLRELGTQTIRGNHDKAVDRSDGHHRFQSRCESRRGLDSLATYRRRSHMAFRASLMDRSPPTAWFWFTARFKMKMNTSSHPRKLSMACSIPPPKSLFSVTPIIRAVSLIKDSNLEVLQHSPARLGIFRCLCASNSRAAIYSIPARSASRATVIRARVSPSPISSTKPLNSGAFRTTFPRFRSACAPPGCPSLWSSDSL